MFHSQSLIKCTGYVADLTIFKRYAGHSKWQNIKHTKALKDGQRALLFTKLIQRMRAAIQESGGIADPDKNLYLAQAIEIAKKQNMPVATIQNTLKAAQVSKSNAEHIWLDIRGPRGCMIIVSALTDNPIATKQTIASILKKIRGVQYADMGCRNHFDFKGVVVATPPKDLQDPTEACVDHAIDAGAEDVQPSDTDSEDLQFICEADVLSKVRKKLESMNYSVRQSDFEYIPKSTVALNDEEMETIAKLLDRLETVPDIVKTYDNIA